MLISPVKNKDLSPAACTVRPFRPIYAARRVFCCLLFAALSLLRQPTALAAPLALVGGTLLDGTGAAALNHSVILIEDERIIAVGTKDTVTIPADATVISTAGMTVLPGLIDLQVHLSELGHADAAHWATHYLPIAERVVMPAAARALLFSGVTTARDVVSPVSDVLSVQSRLQAWQIPGPAVWVSGPALVHGARPDGARYWPIRGSKDADATVSRLAELGVNYVVVAGAADFTAEELQAITQATTAHGLSWWALIEHDPDVVAALLAGAQGLMGFGADLNAHWSDLAKGLLALRESKGTPVPWSVGASILTNVASLQENASALDDPHWKEALPPLVADDIRSSMNHLDSAPSFATYSLRRAVLANRLAEARAAGAHLLMGSDAGEPGQLTAFAAWQEVDALVQEAGLTPAAAIRAATFDAARVLGRSADIGSIAVGKQADIIAVRGDLLRHVDRLQDVSIVIHRGIRYR